MEMEEYWALWTTYPNIDLWGDGTKKCLIHYGYVIDQPQKVIDIFYWHKLLCEVDCEIIYCDEKLFPLY